MPVLLETSMRKLLRNGKKRLSEEYLVPTQTYTMKLF